MSAGNWKPLIWSIVAICIIGAVFTLLVQSFSNVPQLKYYSSPAGDLINSGVNITIPIPVVPDIKFNFNIFSIFGDAVKQFIHDDIIALSLLPTIILLPLTFIFGISIIYGIIKMVLP